jgi:hypothetical protein
MFGTTYQTGDTLPMIDALVAQCRAQRQIKSQYCAKGDSFLEPRPLDLSLYVLARGPKIIRAAPNGAVEGHRNVAAKRDSGRDVNFRDWLRALSGAIQVAEALAIS